MCDEQLNIEELNNDVFFFNDVTEESILRLIVLLKQIDASGYPEIRLHICSAGGDAMAGRIAADYLSQMKTPIHTIVTGHCGSAATFIAMSGNRRYIQPSALMFIHGAETELGGNYQKIITDMRLIQVLNEQAVAFYEKRTHLMHLDVLNMMESGRWLNANECLEYGFVDQIYRGNQLGT